jgi:peptidoglycan hydrolase-like protein with peptidoglycan-binding domain
LPWKHGINHPRCKLAEVVCVSQTLGKKKKSSVSVDRPRSTRSLRFVLTSASAVGALAIVFNAFFNQQGTGNGGLAVVDATSRVTVQASDKTSRTITLKYDALVEDVQRELLATGHFNGLVDGVTGPRTQVAIEAYQRENKLDVTGDISKGLLEHIQYTRKLNQAAEFTGSLPGRVEAKKTTVQPLAALSKPAKKLAAKPAPSGDKAVAKVQERLSLLGYDPGSRSGQLDEGTRSAILIFEMDHGLPMQGKISKGLLTALKAVETKPAKKP